jgi:CBS domain-containing protein
MTTKVKDILKSKGSAIYTVHGNNTVFEALQIMNDKNIGGLLVVDESKLTGIFTERDYARKIVLKGKTSKDTPVSELMTPNPYFVTPEQTIEDCMEVMSTKHIRHLPVMEGETIVGVISISDVVRTIIDNQKFTIDQLAKYITG